MTASLVNAYLSFAFDWIIETSIMASVLVALILCVKVLLRNKLTPRWHYLLWMILIVRLLLPWSPDSSYSIYSLLSSGYKATPFSQNQSIVLSKDEYVEGMKGISNSQTIKEETISRYTTPQIAGEIKAESNPKEQQKSVAFSWYTIASYIWILGIIVLGGITYFTNRRLHQYIQRQPFIVEERVIRVFRQCKQDMGIQQELPLVLAEKTASPTVFGFFCPKVLLPGIHINRLNEQQLQHIFYHELAHIKRRDVGVNWLMHTLLLLNWFNPILWYAYSCMREDQELACDALALTFIDSEEQNEYGYTILSLLENYSRYYQAPSVANLSRNKKTLKRRILMVKNFQKKSYRWSALGIVTIIAVSSVSLLNARADAPTKQQEEQALEKTAVKETEKQSDVSVQAVVEKIIGTREQARTELNLSETSYKEIADYIAAARKFLTKEEFDTYVQLEEEWFTLRRKQIALGGLNEDELNRRNEIAQAQGPFGGKIMENFGFTIEEAQKLVDFPIKKPTYIAEGYQLKVEQGDATPTLGKPNPTITLGYQKEGLGPSYTIYQSRLLEKERDPFYGTINDNADDEIENYELEGAKFSFAYMRYNLKGMKVIVPANGKNSAYQIVIIADDLNKAELEKIMLSLLK